MKCAKSGHWKNGQNTFFDIKFLNVDDLLWHFGKRGEILKNAFPLPETQRLILWYMCPRQVDIHKVEWFIISCTLFVLMSCGLQQYTCIQLSQFSRSSLKKYYCTVHIGPEIGHKCVQMYVFDVWYGNMFRSTRYAIFKIITQLLRVIFSKDHQVMIPYLSDLI